MIVLKALGAFLLAGALALGVIVGCAVVYGWMIG
jgi:hypothetical protein